MSDNLGGKAAKSAAVLGLSQVTKLVLTMLSTIVVSRILSPSDYGVVAMVAPITAFVVLFQDLGLSQAAVQADELSSRQSSSLFWLNLAASAALAGVLVMLSPLVGLFYNEGRAGAVTAAWSLNILVLGTGLQHSALLNRDMRFSAIATIDTVSALTAFAVTLAAALMIKNYWAIWFGSLAGTVMGAALCWLLSGWRPDWKPTFNGVRDMAIFGGNVSAANMVNFFVRNADNIIVAKVSGPAQLGLYDRSYKLMMLPLVNISAPLGRVMLPSLRRLRDDPVAYRRAYLTAVRALMLAIIPGVAVTVAVSERLVPFLLGERWSAASPIFFWLSLTGLVQPLPNSTGWLFITSGRVHEQLRWNIFSAVVTLLGFFLAIPYGAVGVAASLFLTAALRLPILYWYSTVGTSVSGRDLYRSMAEPFIGAAIAIFIINQLGRMLATGPLLLVSVFISYAVTICLFLCTKDGRALLTSFRRLAIGVASALPSRLARRRNRRREHG